ncbi:MAG TPA: type II secretion system F family protein [Candidatus Angelobacter sp.]|jgi:tight adherence protein C|nr:type II secretion system F family protein [Candidatus Angelobacter sp.]
MLLFFISAAVTVFLLLAGLILLLSSVDPVQERLMEITAPAAQENRGSLIAATPSSGVGQVAQQITSFFKPVRGLLSGSDEDLAYKLTLAGFRKPEHVEIFTAIKLLLPVIGVLVGTFFSSNLIIAVAIGGLGGFFLPDMVLSYLMSRRQTRIRIALPDALDLLVICMEAGLGIDQALVRVGDEMAASAPDLAEEFQIITREQRAGKPRLDAWRSLANRLDIEFIRQFVTMLIQTERFGTPIAHALGIFADTLRSRRMQQAEENAAKTGVKLLFPLILFIFPSIFVVSLGPAILNLQKTFQEMAK